MVEFPWLPVRSLLTTAVHSVYVGTDSDSFFPRGESVANTKKTGTKKTKTAGKTTARAKSAAAKAKQSRATAGADGGVKIDRRTTKDRRRTPDRRKKDESVEVERRKLQRRAKVNRRRQIDPTTCERDYSVDEIEFMNALEEYKRASGRMFPTCSEILEVLRDLGYRKQLDEPSFDPPAADGPQADPPLEQPQMVLVHQSLIL